jgi:hypothetical protein
MSIEEAIKKAEKLLKEKHGNLMAVDQHGNQVEMDEPEDIKDLPDYAMFKEIVDVYRFTDLFPKAESNLIVIEFVGY